MEKIVSIDPAIGLSQISNKVIPFEKLHISQNAVYVFDFDGVISSSFEDDIYRLSPVEDEIGLLNVAAQLFDINCGNMEQRYQRHLISAVTSGASA